MNVGLACWMVVLLFSDPPTYMVNDHVDLVEVNHFYDSEGKFVLNQVIYYDWSERESRFHVVDYRLLKSEMQKPNHEIGGSHFSVWHDGSILRCVHAESYLQTWTQHDPEHRERRILSNDERTGLGIIRTSTSWR